MLCSSNLSAFLFFKIARNINPTYDLSARPQKIIIDVRKKNTHTKLHLNPVMVVHLCIKRI